MLAFAAPLRADAPIVLVVGDSLSAAYNIETRLGWVALLGERLTEAGLPHRVVNASVTGDTTRGGAARLPRALDRHRPAAVVLELGGNDGLRGIAPAEMRANLAAMIEASQQAGADVLLVGVDIPPNYGPEYRRRFRAVFVDLSERYEIPLVTLALGEVADTPGMLQADGIHPAAAAQPLMMERIWEGLEPMLRARRDYERLTNQRITGK